MFTKKKFLSFTEEKKHKKCAELIKKTYETILSLQTPQPHIEHYQELQNWMEDPYILEENLKAIADRYHYHLKKAKVNFLEHNLLPTLKKGDRPHATPPLPLSIYLDNLRSAHNVGSIIRTTEAFSLGSLFFSPQTPFIDNKQVQDTSMGAFAWTSCVKDKNLEDLPKPIIALETSPQSLSLHEFIFPPPPPIP